MKKTALYSWHEQAGAKIIDFGGYFMPVQYSGIIAEHKAVREAAGLFDVSHMGNFFVRGARAGEFLQYLTTNDIGALSDGDAQYNLMLYPDGGIVDDLIIYRIDAGTWFLIVNASNALKDFEWIGQHIGAFDGVSLEDRTDALSLVALQGPETAAILRIVLPDFDFAALGTFTFRKTGFNGAELIIARTGYTGEQGVEICMPNEVAQELWTAIIGAGERYGIRPIGLGARDTLRLEMGYSLYGHEIDSTVNPLEARLKWVVKMQKGHFIGKGACEQVELSPRKTVAGFSLEGRALPRQHFKLYNADRQEIGTVCSGTLSPTLQEPIGTCSILKEYGKPGTRVFVEIRGALHPGTIRALPFVQSSPV
ncbi:MAG: glycine cleavage system aminomethyltransferase GcvT [Chlorobium sp.]|uniref:glycine cleavage system aminomethyltransferase GcvT n=1 Tax=Chlorobium sp. TaxID=1095 RepID=UPI0025BD8BC6|nr:glycine cleavage system aminomethyltransferase GcvT [Chlorobium sp.]MCF8215488.1 glycine cleavage system aminomethyltransferase GcvT [Chlorobium sp.]MCF8270287.1 glycine cleavage system aminomethyltransferase GcvT [Chlorobium sp.]MCF8286695.1 glycine cleavage system aminomethyltransferase GcvT [Chlorobium sp.]MCF8290388.1 glycine cleavage system aminomethyltransferase GcvT [Chlorobium sp.]MCF8384271.1 glycine cleavage system aminomethyltransferase GcvT [Chlorobium sp.]